MNNKHIKKILVTAYAVSCLSFWGCGKTEEPLATEPEEESMVTPTEISTPEIPEKKVTVPAATDTANATVASAVYNADRNIITAIIEGKIPQEQEYQLKILDGNGEEVEVSGRVQAASRYTFQLAEPINTNQMYAVSYMGKLTTVIMPYPYSTAAFEAAYTYAGDDLGATWSAEETIFKVWAPTAKEVTLNLYKTGEDGAEDLLESEAMSLLEQGVWYLKKAGDWNGVYYTYTVLHDSKLIETGDPYAKSTGANGKRAMILNMESTNPEGWDKDENPNKACGITDAVIYELHVRDFTIDEDSGVKNKGKYLGLTEYGSENSAGEYTGLTYLQRLGVTHVHIMPMYDFGSVDELSDKEQYNWGYDPVNFNVPEGSYATDAMDGSVRVREVKEMVKALHENGMSVVMDVVYNHVYDPETFSFNVLVPKYFSRTNDYGEYSNGSGCGNDTATERTMVKKYIVDSVSYWVEEYHVDGFRFDLAGLIDTVTMNEIIAAVHEKHPDVIFYGEGWTMDTIMTKSGYSLTTQDNLSQVLGFAMFNDTFRDYVRGVNGKISDGGYVSGNVGNGITLLNSILGRPYWSKEPTGVINYNACHDNNTLFDKLTLANGAENLEQNIQKNKFAAAVLFTSQGTPFMMSGEELLRSKPKDGADIQGTAAKDSFDSNSYKSGDKVNEIKWGNLKDGVYKDVYEYYQGLIAFRKKHGGLRMTSSADIDKYITFAEGLPQNIMAFTVDGSYKGEEAQALYVIYNPTASAVELDIPAGDWKIYVNSQYAGIDSLGGARDKVTIEPYSAMVLAKDAPVKTKGKTTRKRR